MSPAGASSRPWYRINHLRVVTMVVRICHSGRPHHAVKPTANTQTILLVWRLSRAACARATTILVGYIHTYMWKVNLFFFRDFLSVCMTTVAHTV